MEVPERDFRRPEAGGASLDFLGYTFRYDRDLKGRGHKYLNVAGFSLRNGKAA